MSALAQDEGKFGKISSRCNRSGSNTVSSSLNGFDVGVTGWVRPLSQASLLFLSGCLLDLTPYIHSTPALWQRMHRVNEVLSPTHRSFCWWHRLHDFRNDRPSACLTVARSAAQSGSEWRSAAVSGALSRSSSEKIELLWLMVEGKNE